MIRALGILLACQLAGEIITGLLHLPVPGPVIGLALMLLFLAFRRNRPDAELSNTAHGLLKHLSLLFVPAGVGFIVHVDRLGGDLPAIIIGLLVSTLLAIAVSGAVFMAVAKLMERKP
jgi:putative effector of murein hydrolase LrgA (UPF0299 family)